MPEKHNELLLTQQVATSLGLQEKNLLDKDCSKSIPETHMAKNQTPFFSIFLVLFTGALIYSFLNSVIIGFSFFRELPQILIAQNPKAFKEIVEIHQEAEQAGEELSPEQQKKVSEKFDQFFDIKKRINKATEISLDIGNAIISLSALFILVWFHLPLYRFFYRKRKQKNIPERLRQRCKQRLVYSSLVVGCIPSTCLFFIILFSGITLYAKLGSPSLQRIALQGMGLEVFSSIMTGVMLYSWQKYRVQHIYLEHVFTPEELRKKLPVLRDISLRSRLWLVVTITTFFPLTLVVLFVIPSISFYPQANQLGNPQLKLLLGSYFQTIGQAGLEKVALEWLRGENGLVNLPGILFVNMVDTPILLAGLFVGIVISLIYAVFLIRFSTASIIKPLYALQQKMQETSRTGNYHNYAIVQNNDEIGDLGEGFNQMLTGLEEREKVKGLFGQYLTQEVSEEILNGRVKLGGDRFEATIMFSDIRNFTSMSEKMSPEEVLQFLNSYMERMIDVIVEHGGIIDKFMGDGILATFGVPVRSENHAEQALKAALDMQNSLIELNAKRKRENKSAIRIGIGLHTGVVIAGNIGNKRKTEYTVIGDTVNLASRIESMTKNYDSSLLISGTTYKLLPEKLIKQLHMSQIANTSVRGKQETVDLYKVNC
ncbi:MAG: adenylate/guanylate cyclase domain-containing protein [Spirochaetota bacterium]